MEANMSLAGQTNIALYASHGTRGHALPMKRSAQSRTGR